MKKVLNVGQCDADHSRISELLNQSFTIEISRAHTFDETLALANAESFDLILINRLFDRDGSEGMSALNALKTEPATAEVPTMIISNYDDAQHTAVAAGGVPGFGKAALDDAETIQLLSQYLK